MSDIETALQELARLVKIETARAERAENLAGSGDNLLRAVMEAMGCRMDQDPVIYAENLRNLAGQTLAYKKRRDTARDNGDKYRVRSESLAAALEGSEGARLLTEQKLAKVQAGYDRSESERRVLLSAIKKVTELVEFDEAIEKFNDAVPITEIGNLRKRPRAEDYRRALGLS